MGSGDELAEIFLGRSSPGRVVEGVGDNPGRCGDGEADGVAGPDEVRARLGEEHGSPDQDLETENHDGETARGEASEDSGEDGSGGEEEEDGGGGGPEALSGGNPFGDKAGCAGEINDVYEPEGDDADAEEAADAGGGGGGLGVGRGQGHIGDDAGDDQRQLLEDIAPVVVNEGGNENAGDPEEGEDGIEEGEQQSGDASSTAPEECAASEQLAEGGEVRERFAMGHAGLDALPAGGKVAGDEAKEAEGEGGDRIAVETEIGCEGAVGHCFSGGW